MQSLIVSEAEKFSNGSTLLNTWALYEAALDDPDTYPVIAGVYETHTVRGAKGLITRALLAGWIRRTPHATYWFAPGCQP